MGIIKDSLGVIFLIKNEYIQAILTGLIPIISISLIRLLGQLKTFQKNELSECSIEQFPEDDFKKVGQYYLMVFIVSMLLIGLFVFFILLQLAKVYFSLFSQVKMLRFPELAYGVPALFLGIVLSFHFSDYFLRLCLKGQYHRYIKTSDLRYQIDGKKSVRYLNNFVTFFAFLLFAYELRCTSFLDESQIYINKFGTLWTKKYELKKVSKIIHSKHFVAPNGNTIYRSNFIVFFSDNFKWNIDDEGDGAQFIQALSQRSRQSVVDKN